jgi:DNA repair ATPase RecN
MLRRSSVARGIIHILCQRLRARTRDIAADYQYMQQFMRVTAAAVAVEAGVYQPETLDEVAERTDELGQLARVFQRMERQVYSREQRLKQEVEELLIEVDKSRQARQVAEITETDYFQQLQTEAARLREARAGRGLQPGLRNPTGASNSLKEESTSGVP